MEHDDGRRILHKDDLKTLMREAARAGATEAMERLGLDEKSKEDIAEMRDLLKLWRDARSEILRTLIKLATTLAFTALVAGVAIKMKFFGDR